MEIITKKRMMLFTGTIHPALGARDRRLPQHPGEPVAAPPVRLGRDLLPGRRERAWRRRVRGADPLRARERSADGAADHDRRDEAGLGQAHHGGHPVLRLLAAGPQGALARAHQRQAGRRPAVHGRRRPRRSRSTCTPGRSRATSTRRSITSPRCRSCRTTSRTRWACTATTWSWWRPTPAASRPRRSSASTCTPTWRSSTSGAAGTRRTRSRRWRSSVRSKGRPCVIVDDMIDTASTISQGRARARRDGRRADLRRRHPRHLQRQGSPVARKKRRSNRWWSRTRCRSPRSASSTS